jgi:hypothetical protein
MLNIFGKGKRFRLLTKELNLHSIFNNKFSVSDLDRIRPKVSRSLRIRIHSMAQEETDNIPPPTQPKKVPEFRRDKTIIAQEPRLGLAGESPGVDHAARVVHQHVQLLIFFPKFLRMWPIKRSN